MTKLRRVALGLAVACAACQSLSGTLPAPVAKRATGHFRAGAAKADLTPPPGFPMGGFSIIGRIARGYWTRLWVRAIYLEDHDGDSLVLAVCDLWAIPGGLADRVAELVARDEGGRHLGRGQIVLAATHTHHSPGNFSTSPLYNQFASPRAGFDDRLFDFLAHRIAAAIVAAARTAQPATARWAQAALGGIARNRSFEAYVLNPEHAALLAENAPLDIGSIIAHVSTEDAYRAIDPTLTVLRLARAEDPEQLIGVAAFYAVHPTALGPQSELYGSDLFGVATSMAERALAATPRADSPAVVALFNGAEGDVSPNWSAQDRASTVRVGAALGRAIGTLVAAADRPLSPDDRPDLAYRFDRFPIAGRRFESPAGVVRQTAVRPRPGVSQLGGAEDGRTPLFALGWREGVTGLPTATQGAKQDFLNPWGLELPALIEPLLRQLAPTADGPLVLPGGVYQIGDLLFATLPGEFTTLMGRRIAQSIGAAQSRVPADRRRVVLIGLANEYLSYFATPEEYAGQHYEGGATLYGPDSGPLVAHELTRLAAELSDAEGAPMRTFSYETGPTRHFELGDVGAGPRVPDDGLADVVQDLATGRPVRSYPRFEWADELPRWQRPYTAALTPRVAIEVHAAGGWAPLRIDGVPETDADLDFVTVALAATPSASTWAAIWMIPEGVAEAGSYRFRVGRLDGSPICSQPFALPRGGTTGSIPAAPSC